MARGRFNDTFQVSANTDTTLIAAPVTTVAANSTLCGAPERIYIQYIGVTVSVVGATSRFRFEDGLGGDVILRGVGTAADTFISANFAAAGNKISRGYALSQATLLNLNTSGGGAATLDIQIIWEVR